MKEFYQLDNKTKLSIFEQISVRSGLPVYAVEKDWWVVQTLRLIFQMNIAPHIVFKGGTSLSKAWNIIDRFSEDIDLALDRSFLGFGKELSKTQVGKLRKESFGYISEIFYPTLEQLFIADGFEDVQIKLRETSSTDQDPLIIEIYYPTVTSQSKYIEPHVLVELGSRSLKEPNTQMNITSMVSEYFPDKEFADAPISVATVNPERTLLEKIFLLHEEFQKPTNKIRIDRMSRHIYDIERLMRTDFYEIAINNKELYQGIVNHRKSITAIRGIDYTLHQPKTINPIPPDTVLKEWEKDYIEMCEIMIYGDKLSFTDLISRLEQLKNRFNMLKW
jgi:hypothetical protein